MSINNLTVCFGTGKCNRSGRIVRALDRVSLEFTGREQRNIVGVVAQNGGGKTTLFKTILGTTKPTEGVVALPGIPVEVYSRDYFRKLAVVFQENIILPNFTVQDQMNLIANVMGEDAARIPLVLRQMGLEGTVRQRVQSLSGGQQRRLNVAMSMLREAPVLRILDEPACGVDVENRKWLWQYLKRRNEGLTILTTHIMEEAEELCDDVVILKDGRLVCHGSLLYAKQALSRGYQIVLDTVPVGAADFEATLAQVGLAGRCDTVVEDGHVRRCYVGYGCSELISGLLHEYPGALVLCPSLTEIFLKVSDGWDGVSRVE